MRDESAKSAQARPDEVKHRRGNFIVQHFAGPVEYTSEAFLVKNKDLRARALRRSKASISSVFVCVASHKFVEVAVATAVGGTRRKLNTGVARERMDRVAD